MITKKDYENALKVVQQYESDQLDLLRVSNSSSEKLKLGDEIDLDMGNNTIEKVTVVKITPHDCVKDSVYYEFSNGVVCRDIRLH